MIRTANIFALQNQQDAHIEYRKKLHEKAKKQHQKLLRELQTATTKRQHFEKEQSRLSTCEHQHPPIQQTHPTDNL
jgi:hypothetical protein